MGHYARVCNTQQMKKVDENDSSGNETFDECESVQMIKAIHQIQKTSEVITKYFGID